MNLLKSISTEKIYRRNNQNSPKNLTKKVKRKEQLILSFPVLLGNPGQRNMKKIKFSCTQEKTLTLIHWIKAMNQQAIGLKRINCKIKND